MNIVDTINDKLEPIYSNIINYVLNDALTNKKKVLESNGLYEKDMLRWVELKNLRNFIPKMRNWYKAVIKVVIKEFNKKE